jgi:hypothetical protein
VNLGQGEGFDPILWVSLHDSPSDGLLCSLQPMRIDHQVLSLVSSRVHDVRDVRRSAMKHEKERMSLFLPHSADEKKKEEKITFPPRSIRFFSNCSCFARANRLFKIRLYCFALT